MNGFENAIEWERRMKRKYDESLRRRFGFDNPPQPEHGGPPDGHETFENESRLRKTTRGTGWAQALARTVCGFDDSPQSETGSPPDGHETIEDEGRKDGDDESH